MSSAILLFVRAVCVRLLRIGLVERAPHVFCARLSAIFDIVLRRCVPKCILFVVQLVASVWSLSVCIVSIQWIVSSALCRVPGHRQRRTYTDQKIGKQYLNFLAFIIISIAVLCKNVFSFLLRLIVQCVDKKEAEPKKKYENVDDHEQRKRHIQTYNIEFTPKNDERPPPIQHRAWSQSVSFLK